MKSLLRSIQPAESAEPTRDEGNAWLLQSIQEVKQKSSGPEAEQRCNRLFRFLAIQYRLDHPLGQIPFRRDQDLTMRLNDKVCISLLKYLVL